VKTEEKQRRKEGKEREREGVAIFFFMVTAMSRQRMSENMY